MIRTIISLVVVTAAAAIPAGPAEAQASSGDNVVQYVPLTVFEAQRTVMSGVLGIKWLCVNRLTVDLGKVRLGIPATSNDGEKERASAMWHGYVAHPVVRDDATVRFTLKVDINGVPSTFGISTMLHVVIDNELVAQAEIRLIRPT